MKRHTQYLKQILALVIISLLAVGVVIADENEPTINTNIVVNGIDKLDGYPIPPTIGGYTISEGGILENVPSDFAPNPDICDTAAGSYMSEGIDAIRTTMISFDEIVHDNKDPELVLYALYAMEANTFSILNKLFDSPQTMNAVMDFKHGDVVTIGDESTCLQDGALTARLWQLDNGTWAIETIKFNEAYDISHAWDGAQQNNPNLGDINFDMPVLVTNIVVRYMMPYYEPPITTVPGANADAILNNPMTHCDGTAPSYLSIGMDVLLDGYGYTQFPTNIEEAYQEWEFDNTSVALGNYGIGVYIDILNETPLTGIVGNLESVILTPQELYQGVNFGTVVDGPYCTSMNVEPALDNGNGIVEAPDPAHDRFYTWWQIEKNGQVGWYPEVVGQYSHWLYEQEGMFDRKLVMYYLTPMNAQQTQANTCPDSILYTGLEVQPSRSSMNLRANPNGDVIGRLDMGQTTTLYGQPICEGGSNWWQTDFGFIAENDPETQTALLLPAVQAAREAARVDETTEDTVIVTAVPSQPEPQETREPESNDDDKKKDKDRDDDREEGITGLTTATFVGSICDPATGRGCD